MIEQIKQELERESDDFQLTSPRLRKHVYDLIGEVERLKAIEEHAIKRIKTETRANLEYADQVEELRKALEDVKYQIQQASPEPVLLGISVTVNQALERSKP